MKLILKAIATTALSATLLFSAEPALAKKTSAQKSHSSSVQKKAGKKKTAKVKVKNDSKKASKVTKHGKKKKSERITALPKKKRSEGYAKAATYMNHRKPASTKANKKVSSKKSQKSWKKKS